MADGNRDVLEAAVTIAELFPGHDTRAARWLKTQPKPAPEPSAAVLAALACDLVTAFGITGETAAGRIAKARQRTAAAIDRASRAKLAGLPWFDAAFPPLLSEIADPPMFLWMRGQGTALSSPAVALVGARAASPAAVAIARQFGRQLAEAGLVVVSGMARGVDAAAHEGALAADGRTIAVLGCGADEVYPPQHARLAERIADKGLIISEFSPGSPALAWHFPLRNRIISGLSWGTVVVEASDRSGSLITARMALEQGRDVMAVPGGVLSGRSRGCHALLKDGARLVETVEDILDEIGWTRGPAVVVNDNSSNVSGLAARMAAGESYTIDELAVVSGRQTPELLAELTTLELQGRITRTASGGFVRLDESGTDRTNAWPRP